MISLVAYSTFDSHLINAVTRNCGDMVIFIVSTRFKFDITETSSWHRLSLSSLDAYEQALTVHSRLALSERRLQVDRFEFLYVFLLQSIVAVS